MTYTLNPIFLCFVFCSFLTWHFLFLVFLLWIDTHWTIYCSHTQHTNATNYFFFDFDGLMDSAMNHHTWFCLFLFFSIFSFNNSSNHHQNDHPNRVLLEQSHFISNVESNDSQLFMNCSISMIIHYLSNVQSNDHPSFYQIVKSIDAYNVYQLMMNGSIDWFLKWSSTDWSNDSHDPMIYYDPMITWSQGSHDPIILLFIFFSVGFLQTYLIVHRYPYTNSNLITTCILHVDQATSRIRRGRHILINRQPTWVH